MNKLGTLLSGCALVAAGTGAAFAQQPQQGGRHGNAYQHSSPGRIGPSASHAPRWSAAPHRAPGNAYHRGSRHYADGGGHYGYHGHGYRPAPYAGWRPAPGYRHGYSARGYYPAPYYAYPYGYYSAPYASYYDSAYYEPPIYISQPAVVYTQPARVYVETRPSAPPPPPQTYAPAPLAQAAPAPHVAAPARPAPRLERYTLSARELFDFDRSELKYPQPKLDEIAFALKENPQLSNVHVSGHTDRLGTDAYNKKLSQKRADAVKNYLVSRGVEAGRLIAIGRGEANPIVFCTDKKREDLIKCLEPNRRVEVEQITVERSH